jgi:nicotinate-nucleotide pyrophosphorylase (carboxylating)
VELFNQLEWLNLNALLRAALQEDLGQGDVTTAATVTPGQPGRARIVVKESPHIVFCGGMLLADVFRLAGAVPRMKLLAPEGKILAQGARAAEVEGQLAGLLMGERTALNFVQLMSGIASLTRRYVDAVAGTGARIIDTRKTHPGLRMIEKYAVRAGGGFNHRFGLDSGVLIKENHIAAAGSVRDALERARKLAPHTMRVEIECETLAQVEEALGAGADSILLDNMTLDEVRRARVLAPAGRVLLEVSGGVTLEGVRAIAETGVDLISVGALTHSASAVDLSMRIDPL